MQKLAFCLIMTIILTSCTRTYYIVRHAEKAVPSTGNTMSIPDDPELSDEGKARAKALKEMWGIFLYHMGAVGNIGST